MTSGLAANEERDGEAEGKVKLYLRRDGRSSRFRQSCEVLRSWVLRALGAMVALPAPPPVFLGRARHAREEQPQQGRKLPRVESLGSYDDGV